MTRKMERLKALTISRKTKPGLLADGGGLYLRTGSSGARSWIFRYMLDGRSRDMGLGPLHTVSLARARHLASEYRLLKHDGQDPIEHRKAEKKKAKLKSFKSISFAECADEYISSHQAGWKNDKHVGQWRSTIATYAVPIFGDRSIQEVDTELVLKCLKQIWQTKPETASRLRGRIENILDWAKVKGFRDGENPATWKGHLDKLLPARSKVKAIKHYSALPYSELPQFIRQLQEMDGIAARALEFAILTAARTGEIVGATRDEIGQGIWTIPANRMKTGQEHRIPLSRHAKELLDGY
ncbi:MAG: integrase arm-type DNA-binding domain-containing protein [Gammaproteobacteria bacterium]|nr:integrase arm-type DNA-binding domain-containing protein [Gammaproteobacteria bacterium]